MKTPYPGCENTPGCVGTPMHALSRVWVGKLDVMLGLCLLPMLGTGQRFQAQPPYTVVRLSPLSLDIASAILQLSSCGDLWRSWFAVMTMRNSSEQITVYENGAYSPSGSGGRVIDLSLPLQPALPPTQSIRGKILMVGPWGLLGLPPPVLPMLSCKKSQ